VQETTRKRLLDAIAHNDLVLDIGGWADPFGRADWVLDLMPYNTRGLYARKGWVEREAETERFAPETWVQRDICDHEPYPFVDNQFDFVICSQTLEDIRDPVWVCSEMNRIAKAGYIEIPSRLEEQSWGVNGAFVGWSHHRWLIDVNDNAIEFVIKLHALHGNAEFFFPAGFWEQLSAQERVQELWWTDRFSYRERVILDEVEFDDYMRNFVRRELAARPGFAKTSRGGSSDRVQELRRRLRRPGRRRR